MRSSEHSTATGWYSKRWTLLLECLWLQLHLEAFCMQHFAFQQLKELDIVAQVSLQLLILACQSLSWWSCDTESPILQSTGSLRQEIWATSVSEYLEHIETPALSMTRSPTHPARWALKLLKTKHDCSHGGSQDNEHILQALCIDHLHFTTSDSSRGRSDAPCHTEELGNTLKAIRWQLGLAVCSLEGKQGNWAQVSPRHCRHRQHRWQAASDSRFH